MYSNPDVPVIADPINLDAEIKKIQLALAALPWMDKSFGRAVTGRKTEPGLGGNIKVIRFPEVYSGNGEYYPALPNDHLKSQSFVKVRRDRGIISEYEQHGQDVVTYGIDIIVVFNLEMIDAAKTYRFTEELKKDIKAALKTVDSIKAITNIYEEAADVFEGYDIDHNDWQTFKHPRGGFKFECDLSFTEEC